MVKVSIPYYAKGQTVYSISDTRLLRLVSVDKKCMWSEVWTTYSSPQTDETFDKDEDKVKKVLPYPKQIHTRAKQMSKPGHYVPAVLKSALVGSIGYSALAIAHGASKRTNSDELL